MVLAYQIGYLSNLIPIPGGIGVLDGSFVGMFVLYGVNATMATSATLVYHAISLWVPATWGTVAFVLLRRSRNQPIKWRLPRSERRQLRAARARRVRDGVRGYGVSIAEPASPGSVLALIRSGEAITRNELSETLGIARSTVVQRLGVLSDAGLVKLAGDGQSSGGRPASIFTFDESAGVVVVGDLGQTGCHLAVCDLAARPLAEHTDSLSIDQGPEVVIEWVKARFSELLAGARTRLGCDVLGVGIGLPGPVDFDTGRPVSPPAMPGWDGVDVRACSPTSPTARCWSTTTRGSWRWASTARRAATTPHMIFVKIGSGIGAGLIADGNVLRGARGAAGDIGHIVVDPDATEVCRCGNVGCLDAVAGGWAIAHRMGDIAPTPPDVVRLAREGHPEATGQVRRSGRLVGVRRRRRREPA